MIDSHHHLWTYDAEQYPWIPDGSPLHADFGPQELRATATPAGVTGSVVVQARQTVEESRWLIKQAETSDGFIQAVVGWVPLSEPDVGETMAELAEQHVFRGVRHVIQSEPDGFMDADDFVRGVAECPKHGLTFDLLVFGRQLPEAIRFVDRLPNVTIVLDHIAKPTIQAATFDAEWDRDIRELAKRDNVWCKVSGMATEVRDESWNLELLRPYWDTVVEAFGPQRLMFGSDWPVALLMTDYQQWADTVRELASDWVASERAGLFEKNARAAYGIE